jgi:probable rRNA maturation factor
MPIDIDVRLAPGLDRAIDTAWIAGHLRRGAEMLAQQDECEIARVGVVIVDDARMIHLHERHMGIAKTTDVLTFDLRQDPLHPVEADIIICADEAARRAAELKHSVERELLLYSIHGLLHCLGYDDHDEANWQRMHAREDEVLTALGVGATFDAAPGKSDARTHANEGDAGR